MSALFAGLTWHQHLLSSTLTCAEPCGSVPISITTEACDRARPDVVCKDALGGLLPLVEEKTVGLPPQEIHRRPLQDRPDISAPLIVER